MHKLKIGVLMGGKSIEKEVSFNSGRTICNHLDTARYTVIPLFHHTTGELYILPERFLCRGKISDFAHKLDTQAEHILWQDLKKHIDFMYIATHGQYAEDGTLQGFLEILQIPYLGSKVIASALGMDKIIQKQLLDKAGIKTPKSIAIYPEQFSLYKTDNTKLLEALAVNGISLPCIIKPHKEGSSLGVSVAHTLEDIQDGLEKAIFINRNKPEAALIEEYITGMEFSCIIITDYKTGNKIPLPPTEIVPENNTDFFDYQQKYMPGRATKFTPARCSSQALYSIQNTCIQVMDLLEMHNIARIDGFLTDDNTVIIIDPNTLAGMAPSSFLFRQAAELNMSHTAFINHLIETELHYYAMVTPKIVDTQEITNKSTQVSHNKKVRVGVLFGGRSHEKEISLESGRNIFYKLSPHTYEPIALFLDSDLNLYQIEQTLLVRNSTKELTSGLTPSMHRAWDNLAHIVDFVFIGLHGGEGENGCIQGTLELLGIPYNGSSVLTSALCMNKYKTTSYLRAQGFCVPKNVLISKADTTMLLEKIEPLGSFPLIVKPNDDGCSTLVYKVQTIENLIDALEAIFNDGKEVALVEECITGMELTVGVIGNATVQALPPSYALTSGDILSIEEKFLPGAGENQTPAPLRKEALIFVQQIIENAYKAVNCKGYARIDCFYQNASQSPTGSQRMIILEINTLPGLTPATCIFHQAAELGIKPMDFIDMIIQLGLEEHSANSSISRTDNKGAQVTL
jgi:UDP-N-acetylmuramate--alanine ligase